MPTGCTCNAGYSGTPLPSLVSPFYTMPCTAVPCPPNSTGSTVASGCTCNAGFSGNPSPTLVSPFYLIGCTAVSCPSFTTGTTIASVSGCSCSNSQGYYGTASLIPAATSPFYTSTCFQFSSCQALKTQSFLPVPFGSTSGVYYITYPGSVVLPAYCDQVTNGGGWELVLKISTTAGSAWTYSSARWTSTTTVNPTSLDETDVDAQLPQYVSGSYSQVHFAVDL